MLLIWQGPSFFYIFSHLLLTTAHEAGALITDFVNEETEVQREKLSNPWKKKGNTKMEMGKLSGFYDSSVIIRIYGSHTEKPIFFPPLWLENPHEFKSKVENNSP